MWKVPFRSVYCDTFTGWLRATFWCHCVIKVFPGCIDLQSDHLARVGLYHDRPEMMFEQYQHALPPIDRTLKDPWLDDPIMSKLPRFP